MDIKAIIDFLILNNTQIIQWLVASILLLIAGLLGWNFFRKPETKDSENEDLKKVLKEVLETTRSQQPPTVAVTASEPGREAAAVSESDAGAVNAAATAAEAKVRELQSQIESLKKSLAENQSAAASGSGDQEALKELDSKVKELEAKLAEYEILEDDIADIALYKEENERLKKQLASLGEISVASADEEPVKPPLPEDEEFTLPEDSAPNEKSEEIVAEFEAAVKVGKDVAPAPAEAVPAREDLTNFSADDLMAEFEKSMSDGAGDSTSEAGDLDTEKMLAEMADLEALPADAVGSALEDDVDTEKMAAEATDLAAKG